MSARTPLARRVIAALLLVLLTACHSWRPTTVSPQGWTPEERPSSVRATLRSGEIRTVWEPTMRNDSIVSATGFAGAAAVALRDVRLLEVRHSNIAGSIGLGLLASVAVLFLAAAAACAGGGCVRLR